MQSVNLSRLYFNRDYSLLTRRVREVFCEQKYLSPQTSIATTFRSWIKIKSQPALATIFFQKKISSSFIVKTHSVHCEHCNQCEAICKPFTPVFQSQLFNVAKASFILSAIIRPVNGTAIDKQQLLL